MKPRANGANPRTAGLEQVWQRCMCSRVLTLPRTLSACLVIMLGIGAANLFSNDPQMRLVIPTGPFAGRVMPSAFIYEDSKFSRIGRLDGSGIDGTTIELFVPSASLPAHLSAVIVEPTFSRFLQMQPAAVKADMRARLSLILQEALSDVFKAIGDGEATISEWRDSLVWRALSSAAKSSDFAPDRELLEARWQSELSPRLTDGLIKILRSRLSHAASVILADAAENYWTDLALLRFDLSPVSEAAKGLMTDTATQKLLAELAAVVSDDPRTSAAATRYLDLVVDQFAQHFETHAMATATTASPRVEQKLREVLRVLEGEVFKDGIVHPVMHAMALNLASDPGKEIDGVIVLIEIENAIRWFPPEAIIKLAPTDGL